MEQVKNEEIIYKVGVYCRLSKDDELAGESVSIETQKMLLADYCHEQGFSIYEVYADDGYSGLNFNRPASNRMLEDIDSGKINLVITKDLSRLGRDMENHKYEVINYKTKECVRVPKEEHIIVSDCHEAIIAHDDYERVQTLISIRHRPKTHNFENVFKNLIFCSECRQRMTLMMKPLKAGSTPLIRFYLKKFKEKRSW